MKLGLGQQIERIAALLEDDYTTDGEQVKRAFEGTLGSARSFGNGRDSTQVASQQGHDQTRFAELDRAKDDRCGLFRRQSRALKVMAVERCS